MCERWQSFEAFLEDMGPKTSPDHSVDRIDSDLGYEPGNVRWATKATQSRNRRCTKLTPADAAEICSLGGRISNTQLANRFGVSVSMIYKILDGRGWRDAEQPSTLGAN